MSDNQFNRQEDNQNRPTSSEAVNNNQSQTQVDPEIWYSEEDRRPDNRPWEEYRRSIDHSRVIAIDYERENLQDLVAGENIFLGISEYHPVPNSLRYSVESVYRSETVPRGQRDYLLNNPIRTTITLYPRGYPVFEFTDPVTNTTTYAAFPSARDLRLDRNTRIILQALEVSFQDPNPYDWEEYYHGN